VQDLMITAVEHRFGPVNRLPQTIEWLTDNGSCYVADQPGRVPRSLDWSRAPRRWRARNRMAWQKPSCARSSVITSASVPARMPAP
jgi:transposase InsO family protein